MSNTPDINGWMPIESAPKDDGSMFIINDGYLVTYDGAEYVSGDFGHPVIVKISLGRCPSLIGCGTPVWYQNNNLPYADAVKTIVTTHWHPLPKPPVTNSSYTIL